LYHNDLKNIVRDQQQERKTKETRDEHEAKEKTNPTPHSVNKSGSDAASAPSGSHSDNVGDDNTTTC
jgi:hypothetical protein